MCVNELSSHAPRSKAKTWLQDWCSFREGQLSGSAVTAVDASMDPLMGEPDGTHSQRERLLLLWLIISI